MKPEYVGKKMKLERDERCNLFRNVYDDNLWGVSQSGGRFNSDSPPELTKPYREFVSGFIRQHDILCVVDLGCGDFEASSGIEMDEASYIGVDIYDELIKHNNEHFGSAQRQFVALDLVEDELPLGDLCLITMVLYILSNDEIIQILNKLNQYRYALITDGQADISRNQRQNIDKPTDKYTRRDHYNNGLYLELPPFNLDVTVVCEYQIPSGEIIRTVLWERP